MVPANIPALRRSGYHYSTPCLRPYQTGEASKDREHEDGAFRLQRSSRTTIQKSAEAARESAQHRSRVMFYDDCRAKRPWQHSLVGGAPSDPLNGSRLGGELRNASPVMKVPVPVPGDAPYHVKQNLIYFWNHSI